MLVQILPFPRLFDQSINILIEYKLIAEQSVSRISIREWLATIILAQYSGIFWGNYLEEHDKAPLNL